MICLLFMRGTGTMVGGGDIMVTGYRYMLLHGVGIFMDAVDGDGQHHYEEHPGKEFKVDNITHK